MTRTPLHQPIIWQPLKGKGHHTTTATIKYTTLLERGRIRLAIPHTQKRICLIVSRCVRAEWIC